MENKQEKIISSVDWKQFCKAFGKAILCLLAIYTILISIVFIYTTITAKHPDPNTICGLRTSCENNTGNFVCSTNSFKDSTLYRCNLAGYTANLASSYIFIYYLGLFMIIMTLPLSIMRTVTQGDFALLFSIFSLITFLPYILLSALIAWFHRTPTK